MTAHDDMISAAKELARAERESQFRSDVSRNLGAALDLLADHAELLRRDRDKARLALATVREDRDSYREGQAEMRDLWLSERNTVIAREKEIRELKETIVPNKDWKEEAQANALIAQGYAAEMRDAERTAGELGLVGPGAAHERMAAEIRRISKRGVAVSVRDGYSSKDGWHEWFLHQNEPPHAPELLTVRVDNALIGVIEGLATSHSITARIMNERDSVWLTTSQAHWLAGKLHEAAAAVEGSSRQRNKR